MSLNLQDPLLRLTGIHPRQIGGPLFCQFLTDFARGGRRANSTPGHVEFSFYADKNVIPSKRDTCCHCGEIGRKDPKTSRNHISLFYLFAAVFGNPRKILTNETQILSVSVQKRVGAYVYCYISFRLKINLVLSCLFFRLII